MTNLIIYGITDTTRQANAAQVKKSPGPTETMMPSGIVWLPFADSTTRSFIAADRWTITVQMLAPISRRRLPAMANKVETKKVMLCLATPLCCGLEAGWKHGELNIRDESSGCAESPEEEHPVRSLGIVSKKTRVLKRGRVWDERLRENGPI